MKTITTIIITLVLLWITMMMYMVMTEERKVTIEINPKTQMVEKSEIKIALFTAYNSTIEQCGKDDGITASGKLAKVNHTIACPPEYKFGTKIRIAGMGIYTCEDRGGAIKGEHFDIYFGDKTTVQEAKNFGEKYLGYEIIN